MAYRLARITLRTLATVPVLALGAPQGVTELAPAVMTLRRTYQNAPDGLEFYRIRDVVIERGTGALWVKYGEEKEPPVRIDRRTGTSRVIGRNGSGPNEYQRIIAMASGANGEVGVWDPSRLSWFWVNGAGVHTRTWKLNTSALAYGQNFADQRGRVYITQPDPLSKTGLWNPVRLDSARGLRDTIRLPVGERPVPSWSYTATVEGGTATSSTTPRFAPSRVFVIDALGRPVAAWRDSNVVVVRDGAALRRLVLPVWNDPLTSAERQDATADLDLFEANGKQRNAVFSGPRPPLPSLRPQIDRLTPEINGGVVVSRSRLCGRVPAWRAPGTGARAMSDTSLCVVVERFDATGRRLTPFTLGAREELKVVYGDTVWTSISTADGLASIREYVIPPS